MNTLQHPTSDIFAIRTNLRILDFLTGEKITISPGLHLISSTLGWLLGGRQAEIDSNKSNTSDQAITTIAALLTGSSSQINDVQFAVSNHTQPPEQDLTFMWNLETLGIKERLSDPGDEAAMQNFNRTVVYKDNRYFVTWPWKEENPELPSNYQLALGRLNALIHRSRSNPDIFQQYHKVIDDQLQRGVIEKVEASQPTSHKLHYIPHHAVFNPERTTKLRIVYDASAKPRSEAKSLNDCLYRGPVILDDVVAILLRFRLNPIALAADIEKAFLQVGLQETERDVTRFLWLRNPTVLSTENNVQTYRFTRVPFGITSNPFLLSATIQHHLRAEGGEIATSILRDIYVDNIISGASTEAAATEFYHETKRLFSAASMNAREWMTNSSQTLDVIPPGDRATGKCKILGLPWNPAMDDLSIPTPKNFDQEAVTTKRSILKHIASFFDPLGLLSPALVQGKILLQQLWKDNVGWDDQVSAATANQWASIANDLAAISTFKLPRFLGNGTTYELHAFCDASKDAYGACIYLRIIDTTRIQTHLVFAKARLAPLRPAMTIPRLELLAVHLGRKCLSFIVASLQVPIHCQFVWTDSQCVLHWLQSEKPLSVFVRNRINQIKDQSKVDFRFVGTEQNPADFASRGLPAPALLECAKWWHGPDFLSQTTEHWPSFNASDTKDHSTAEKIAAEERRRCTTLAAPEPVPAQGLELLLDYKKFSSFTKLIRATAWLLRAVSKIKPASEDLTAAELQRARLKWFLHIQQKCFAEVLDALKSSRRNQLVTDLSLWIDEDGLIRCGGRLQHADLPAATKFPILLPPQDQFTTLVIASIHNKLYHVGVSHTLANIRDEFWIPAGRSAVFRFIRSCNKCKKFDQGPYRPPSMPALPDPWVREAKPFTTTGLDYLGPLYTKDPRNPQMAFKTWICLFTCLTTRAIHLELVPDLSAEQFLLALQRFVNRRGKPTVIYSDNASNFKLVQTSLERLWNQAVMDPRVQSYVAVHGIHWKFITERAPWMGGYYERLVRLVKQSLRKSLGRLRLTFMQLQTVITEVEAILNSRPLLYVGSDFESGFCLTPAHFLTPIQATGMPSLKDADMRDPTHLEHTSSKDRLLAIWNKGQQHLEQFWRIWKQEYLLSLRERAARSIKTPNRNVPVPPKVGDVVLIRNDGPRRTWPLGRITKLIPGMDALIRSAKVRLASGAALTRSVTHLYPLECSSSQDSTTIEPAASASGVPPPTVSTTPADPQYSAATSQRPKRPAAELAKLQQSTAEQIL